MWTQFMDMHSGGRSKEDWEYIYIEAPEDEAKVIFYNRFGHNPERVTCTCCGEDYSITESKTLEQATAYERGCAYGDKGYIEKPDDPEWRAYRTLEEYLTDKGILVIRSNEIKDEEREGECPTEGYLWV